MRVTVSRLQSYFEKASFMKQLRFKHQIKPFLIHTFRMFVNDEFMNLAFKRIIKKIG